MFPPNDSTKNDKHKKECLHLHLSKMNTFLLKFLDSIKLVCKCAFLVCFSFICVSLFCFTSIAQIYIKILFFDKRLTKSLVNCLM